MVIDTLRALCNPPKVCAMFLNQVFLLFLYAHFDVTLAEDNDTFIGIEINKHCSRITMSMTLGHTCQCMDF